MTNKELVNNGWEEVPEKSNPFTDGSDYHLGNLNDFNKDFVYRGIFKFENGFFDNGYFLKPFPTHYIYITKPFTGIEANT